MAKKSKSKKPKSVVPEEFLKNLNALDLLDGNFSDNDALALMKLTKESVPKKIAPMFLEIGCWKGKSTAILSAVASKYPSGRVYVIDHFRGASGTSSEQVAKTSDIHNIFKNNMKTINAWDQVVCLMEMDTSKAFSVLQDNSFDFVFVDADNNYIQYLMHLNYAKELVRIGGIVCGRNLVVDYMEAKKEVDEEIDKEYSQKYKLHPGIVKSVFEVFGNDYKRIDGSGLWYWRK